MTPFDPTQHLITLQSKTYLEVKWRLVWFREAHPDGQITTEILEHNPAERWAVIRATVVIPGKGSATGMVIQSPTGVAKDYIANGETSAIGRALAALGYGTQHATELDQGDQVVDSPVARPATTIPPASLPGKPADDGPSEAQLRKLHAVVRERNWTPDAVKAAMRDLWGVMSSKDLTKYQCGLLIDIVEDRMQIERDAAGKARLGQVPPAADGLLPESALPWGGDTGEGR